FDVDAAEADFVAIDAGKIGLATDSRGHAAVQRVIPGVQLPDSGCIDGGNEIAHAVDRIDDELVSPNAIEGRHRIVGQFVGGPPARSAGTRRVADAGQPLAAGTISGQGEAPAAVREADDAALLLAPL